MTSRSRGQRGRRFAQPNETTAQPVVPGPEPSTSSASDPPAGTRWRRTSVGTPDRTGAFSTTIRFREERYRWLHQVAATTGRSKSDLVDEALELLAQQMGYGTRSG